MLSAQDIIEAESRIRPLTRETPVDRSLHLSRLGNANVYLKLEHLQHTGSFKLRGAANKIFSLDEERLRKGVIAASTGNHGMGVCYAARHAGATATIYLPRDVSEQKLAMIEQLGGTPVVSDGDCLEAEYNAREAADKSGQVFISPYNDLQVIAGQGTVGFELARQLDRIDAVFVAVGGGGLISGIATYLKSVSPHTHIIGCWPENSRALYECLRAGKIIKVPEEPTISESTAGGVEEASVTFPLCQQLIDDYALVSEAEIREAMRLILDKERWIIEGSAGVAVAAYLKEHDRYAGQNIAIILCGRNMFFNKTFLDFTPSTSVLIGDTPKTH
ncbi:MAG: threonine/serine dehydratase [Blastocatellia bacterium]